MFKSFFKKLHTIIEKHFITLLKTIVLLEVIILTLACFKHIFSHDEIEFLRSGWFLSQGNLPYSEFLENHHPLYFYIIAPFFSLFSNPLSACMAIRLITCMFFFTTMLGVFSIAHLLYNIETALFSAGLVPAWFMTSRIVFETRPDIPQVTCAVWSVYFLIKAIKNKKPMLAFLSGVFFSLAFLFLQKSVLLIGILVAVLILEIYIGNLPWIFLLMLCLGSIITITPYYFYLWKTKQLLIYWQLCYEFNQYIFNTSLIKIISPLSFLRFICASSMHIDRILWAFFILGSLTIKNKRQIIPILGAAMIGLLWATKNFEGAPQYHILFAPFISIIAGYGLFSLSQNNKLATYIFFLTCLYPIHFHLCTIIFPLSTCQNQINEAKYCMNLLQKNDCVAISNYHLLFYNDSHPIWYLYDGLKKPYEKATGKTVYSWIEGIKKHRPVFIGKRVATYENLDKTSYFKDNYTQVDQYPNLYIRKDKI